MSTGARRSSPTNGIAPYRLDATTGSQIANSCVGQRVPPEDGTRYSRAALASEVANVDAAPPGRRTISLFKAACVAGELIGGGEISRETAEAALRIVADTRGIGDADRQIRRGIQRGLKHPRNPNLTNGRHITTKAEARIVIHEWSEALDATGTDRRICLAIASHCWNVGTTTVDLSYREISETSGMSRSTVSNHAGRLGRWVRIVRHGQRFRKGDTRTRWRLVIREGSAKRGQAEGHPLYGVGGLFENGTTLRDPSANHWYRWSSGWSVWSQLDPDDVATVVDLVNRSGCSRRTVFRTLAKLKQLGLAERTETGWLQIDVELDRREDFSIREFRRRRHRIERDRHAAFLESRYDGKREVGP
jgi:hypothetical protein